MVATNHDLIGEIDAAIGCQQCGGHLGASPSNDFCSPRCQAAWSAARVQPLTNYVEPYDLPAHVNNQVELYSPEVDPSGEWWQGAVIAAHRREARARFEARNRAAASHRPIDNAVAAALAFGARRRPRAVGVTPDGEVIVRDPSGQPVVIAHVAQRPGEVVRHTDVHTERHQIAPGVGQHIGDQLNAAIGGHGVADGAFTSALANMIAEIGRASSLPPEMVASWMAVPSIAEQVYEAERERVARIRENQGRLRLVFECVAYDPDAVARLFLNDVVRPEPAPDPRQRALELRRNRNTGPATSARAPRAINPRRSR